MRIYIIRHADPDYANDTITAAGHREAEALAGRLTTIGLTHLYTSPLRRARHTAQYTERATGQTARVQPWTAELSDCHVEIAPWGKLCMWDAPGELIRQGDGEVTARNWTSRPPFTDPVFAQRIDAIARGSDEFLARHGYQRENGRYRIVQANTDKLAIFCHGGFGLCWLAHLLAIPLPLMWSSFWLAPSSVTTVLMDERSNRWAVPRALGVADVSHLFQAGLAVQPHGIKANFE